MSYTLFLADIVFGLQFALKFVILYDIRDTSVC